MTGPKSEEACGEPGIEGVSAASQGSILSTRPSSLPPTAEIATVRRQAVSSVLVLGTWILFH